MEKRRTRNWATVVYPESAPADWKMILQEECVPALVSPIHDKDVNADGEIKKEHYHVMILFDGVKTQEQAQEIFSAIGGVGVEPIKSVRSYARYLGHKSSYTTMRFYNHVTEERVLDAFKEHIKKTA